MKFTTSWNPNTVSILNFPMDPIWLLDATFRCLMENWNHLIYNYNSKF